MPVQALTVIVLTLTTVQHESLILTLYMLVTVGQTFTAIKVELTGLQL